MAVRGAASRGGAHARRGPGRVWGTAIAVVALGCGPQVGSVDDGGGEHGSSGGAQATASTGTTVGAAPGDASTSTGGVDGATESTGGDPSTTTGEPWCADLELCLPCPFGDFCGLRCDEAVEPCLEDDGRAAACVGGSWECTTREPPDGCANACTMKDFCTQSGGSIPLRVLFEHRAETWPAGTWTFVVEVDGESAMCTVVSSADDATCAGAPPCVVDLDCRDGGSPLLPNSVSFDFGLGAIVHASASLDGDLLVDETYEPVYSLHWPNGPGQRGVGTPLYAVGRVTSRRARPLAPRRG